MTSLGLRLLFGLLISVLDFVRVYRRQKHQAQTHTARHCLEEIEYVLDVNSQRQACDAERYHNAIMLIRRYLDDRKLIRFDLQLLQRAKQYLSDIPAREVINRLSLTGLLVLAFGLEFIYDFLFGFHLAAEQGVGLISATIANLYQAPVLFAGLWSGRKLITMVKWILLESQMREVERVIGDCIKNTALMDLVVSYEPDQSLLREGLAEVEKIRVMLTRAGRRVSKTIGDIGQQVSEKAKELGETVVNYSEQQQEKQRQDAQQRKSKFDGLTKDR
jgi:hypothetical protein